MRALAPHAARSTRCSLPRHARALHAPCTRTLHMRHALRRRLSQTWEPDGAAKYAALAASWLVAIGEASEASCGASGRGAAFAAPLVPILEPACAAKRSVVVGLVEDGLVGGGRGGVSRDGGVGSGRGGGCIVGGGRGVFEVSLAASVAPPVMR